MSPLFRGKPSIDTLLIGSWTRSSHSWARSFAVGEECVIPLKLEDPYLETRVFLKHQGLSYLHPLGDWDRRTEIRFLPEAPGTYTVDVEWRSASLGTGWTQASFEVGRARAADASPRLVSVDRHTRLWVPSEWETQFVVEYEKKAMALAAKFLRPGSVIYDVGANLGLYSVVLSRMAGAGSHVYCIEANPVCLYFLRANLALNKAFSYEILPVALLGRETTTEFRINYANLFVGIAGPIAGMRKPGHRVELSAVALDDLIDARRLRPPGFIKMDIEGAEVEAIKGMRRTIANHRPTILVEVHGRAVAAGMLAAPEWDGYRFVDAASGRSFDNAAALAAWCPDACLQIVADQNGS
jgi:FkbM family methyltransferase